MFNRVSRNVCYLNCDYEVPTTFVYVVGNSRVAIECVSGGTLQSYVYGSGPKKGFCITDEYSNDS